MSQHISLAESEGHQRNWGNLTKTPSCGFCCFCFLHLTMSVQYLAVFCDLFVIVQSFWACRLCSSESEPRKPKSERPCILRNNSLLCHFSVPHFSVSGKILKANRSKYSCRQILVHADPYMLTRTGATCLNIYP